MTHSLSINSIFTDEFQIKMNNIRCMKKIYYLKLVFRILNIKSISTKFVLISEYIHSNVQTITALSIKVISLNINNFLHHEKFSEISQITAKIIIINELVYPTTCIHAFEQV